VNKLFSTFRQNAKADCLPPDDSTPYKPPFQSELADNAEFLLYCKCGGQSDNGKAARIFIRHFRK
jgi:rhodanese-related sulfurtransferase